MEDVFDSGYWGPVVGFYGGIDYGFGYFGRGFEGGRWERRGIFRQPLRSQCECHRSPQRL